MLKKAMLSCLTLMFILTGNLAIPVSLPSLHITSEAAISSHEEVIWHSGDGKVSIDTSGASNGYIKVRYNGNSPDVKVIISQGNNASYPFWMDKQNEYQSFSLTFGNGDYQISVLEQTQGNYYSMAFSKKIAVNLKDATVPFLQPNFFVDYTQDTAIVKHAATLHAAAASNQEFIEKVYNFVKQYSYDFEKSYAVSSPNAVYKTNFDEISILKKGICLDYAAVMTAMLRSQGIPAKLEFGYVDNIYHSWVNVYVPDAFGAEGYWQIFDPTLASTLDEVTLNTYLNHPNYYNPIFIN